MSAGARHYLLAAKVLEAMDCGDYTRDPVALDRVFVARAALRDEFSLERCWVQTKVAFGPVELRRGVLRGASAFDQGVPYRDHCVFFRCGRRPVAIVSQPYNVDAAKQAEMVAWAASAGLTVNFPDFPGWHFPGRCQLCVFEAQR